jgi:ABC-type uncharacterized transport system substrate-binding protein
VFTQRLRELGWAEGRNIVIEVRWAEVRTERLAEISDEILRLKVDVIVTYTPRHTCSQKGNIDRLNCVRYGSDPVGTGIVTSLARPGGNVTGLSSRHTDTVGKRLGLLREVVPRLRWLAILLNAGSSHAVLESEEVQTAARAPGLELAAFEIGRAEGLAAIFDTLNSHADAIYVVPDPFINVNRSRITTLALGVRLPMIHGFREVATVISLPCQPCVAAARAANRTSLSLENISPTDARLYNHGN